MKYWNAYNTGHGFITNEDRVRFSVEGKPCDIWITDDSEAAIDWAERNNATSVTQQEAEALWAQLPEIEVLA